VLVRIHAAGVGIWDVGILSGMFGQALPSIPGCEIAGTVQADGDALEHVAARHTVGRVVVQIGS
jgi:NADPH:quinone reductase-like Zn-dependent oxidoreductase